MGKMKEMYEAMTNGDLYELIELLEEQREERKLMDESITELAEEYHSMIGADHHKDRDCHWSICNNWEYGSHSGYVVTHNGYLYQKVEEYFDTYEEAQESLLQHLKNAIDNYSSIRGYDVGGEYDE